MPEPIKKVGDFAHLDMDRATRRGYPEAVYCERKTVEQVGAIAAALADSSHTTLFTRASAAHLEAISQAVDAFVDAEAGFAAYPATPPEPTGEKVLVVCAGTSDLPVAREAEYTARYLGRDTRLIADVGVAGIHRLLSYEQTLHEAGVIVVVAGMDGALPGVVAGLVKAPVVAVPTSVGYGAGAGGIAPLLTMLNACAPGIGVVNIDNGYGAGHLAAQIAAR
ncbi:nickel pincer cofactor biosynthesis protein LarB [Corynebacterium uterequi]|uniref:NCAIR mutase-like protein n=1 Tax=Corynebacterium uterequi TaxID=1072256 RepID=A0A0G3HF79_9CORY|nr:nickel pincer cofactor biosynthesis protein LarB [Corynebacterium uterequi]AKK12006.1 NCAIR mutase-like protein [Corynebacterium uterequi]